jgi:integrase
VPPVLHDLRADVVGIDPHGPALPRERVRPSALAARVALPRYADDTWNLGLLHHGSTVHSMVVNWAATEPEFREPLRAALWVMVNAAPPATADAASEDDEAGKQWAEDLGGLIVYPGPGTCHLTWETWSRFVRWLLTRGIRRLAAVSHDDFKAWATETQRVASSDSGRRNRLVAVSRLWIYSHRLPASDRLPKPPWNSRNIAAWIGDDVPARGDNTTAPISAATMSPLLVAALFYVDLYLAWLDGDLNRRETILATWPSLDPERSPRKFHVVGRLSLHDRTRLAGACLVVVAYLTGMRPDEVLSLTRGCARIINGTSGIKRYEIIGTETKGVRDQHGRHITGGRQRPHPWVTIEPAYRAVRVLEALADEVGSDLLFAPKAYSTRQRTAEALTSTDATNRIQAFVEWANGRAALRGHPSIPPCQRGKVTLRRFRRTLAWHIVRQPGGVIALGVQYGHLRLVTSQGYAGRREAGLLDDIDLEEVHLALDTIDEIAERQAQGEVISGPAAAALEARVEQSHEFLGKVRTDRELSRLKDLPHLKVYDVPETLVVCVFRPATAACLDGEDADNRRTPSLNRCVTGCGNAARMGKHVEGLRRLITEAEADRDASPAPLAQRLERRIRIWKAAVEEHEAREREAAAVS